MFRSCPNSLVHNNTTGNALLLKILRLGIALILALALTPSIAYAEEQCSEESQAEPLSEMVDPVAPAEEETLSPEEDESELQMQASAGWTSLNSCEWRLSGGTFTIRPQNGSSGYVSSSLKDVISSNSSSIRSFVTEGTIQCSYSGLSSLFAWCSQLRSADLSGFDFSYVTSLYGMFYYCDNLQTVIFPTDPDTSNVTSMSRMFCGCRSLSSVNLGGFDTSNVSSMLRMFEECSSLKTLNLSSFDTSEAASYGTSNYAGMTGMFLGCQPDTLILGSQWKFGRARIDLWTPYGMSRLEKGKQLTGRWKNGTRSLSTSQLISSYSGTTMAGTWTAETGNITAAPMYRLYNPYSGEHFYTANAAERNNIVKAGWKAEGIGWTAPSCSYTPVYRLYSGTDHHYTTSASERDYLTTQGWSYEGIGWYSDDAKGVPLYRQYNPYVNPRAARNNSGSHNYTISKSENDFLVRQGWKAEGIGWYGMR